MLLSVVIPVYRGAKTIGKLVEKLHEELNQYSFEIVLVNDGSPDDSEQVCLALSKKYKNITFVSLRKNFGEFNAVMCGLNHVRGDYAVMIDDDFQNPPSEIIKLLKEAEKTGHEVIYTYYSDKKHSIFRNFGSWLVNQLATRLLNKPKGLYLSSFKLISKEIVNEICHYKGPFPYIDGIIFSLVSNVGSVHVEHSEREEGRSNYTFSKLSVLFLTIIFGYSILPARFILLSGFFLILLSLLLFGLDIWGVMSQYSITVFMFFGGVQLMSLGIIGEYMGRMFLTQNNYPQYSVKYKVISHAE
ncbi:glycosyltransferase family 2 protein [Arcicella rosea]|uniref:Undecaprenyl-phosphate 4-deoxy-4-formamido-L-arabinose transferase n=1 Tax=Arcicella rosea TaxID=502909 RepID=A0A841ERR1_9BACT|nr:glycosyltransferase family 2 protein [Arcicella rosea]MBB6003368.1 undecaprenyl-phosphate 4-deoxy-4-formamido-L-arabinose transferase [Arcicella rosea]